MKKLLLGCALAVSGLFMPLANAQDYCCPPPYSPCCDTVDFNGFYVGGNVGVYSNVSHHNDLNGFFTGPAGWSAIHTNVTAGIQVGYDWQCCNKLLGVVVDWNWANNRHRLNEIANNYIRNEHNWFVTIRGRAGVTVCDALLYVTGGGVAVRTEKTWNSDPDNFNDNHTRWGWVGGVGAEFLVWCNWSIGAEFLFMHFAESTRSFTGATGAFSFSHSDSAYIGRVLLNYRFGDLFSCFCR